MTTPTTPNATTYDQLLDRICSSPEKETMPMSDAQFSADNVALEAEEVFRMGALIYAGKIVATVSATPPGPEAPAALDAARKVIHPGNDMPAVVASALRNLQMAAALFTLDLADGHMDSAALQQLENELEAALKRRGSSGIVHTRDDEAATRGLSDRALDYAYQIIVAQESNAPIGSDVVKHSMGAFQLAAVSFTVHLTIAEGLDPKIPRWIEENLVALFEQEARAS